MKTVITTLAITAVLATLAFTSGKIYSSYNENNVEQLLACHWFPICRDPDFQLQQEDTLKPIEIQSDTFDVKDVYACHWFPICRDPDLPFADEVATTELV